MPLQAFISYSHTDKVVAQDLAEALVAKGIEVWWDRWEIAPGDSLVDKIFREGLRDMAAFIPVISNASVNSPWVKDELDVATVRRIEDSVRIVAVRVDDAAVPEPLRHLLWIDIRDGFDASIARIADAIHGIRRKPALGAQAAYLKAEFGLVDGVSRLAGAVGSHLVSISDLDSGVDRFHEPGDIAQAIEMTPQQFNDAVAELEAIGYVETPRTLSNSPFNVIGIKLTHRLVAAAKAQLDYDPDDDMMRVCAALAAKE